MRTFILFLIIFTLTSCAAIFNKETYDIKISSNEKDAKVKVNDTIYELPAKVKVHRSKEDLELTLIKDTLNLDYKAKAINSSAFYFNTLYPPFYIFDWISDKKFSYGKHLYLNSNAPTGILNMENKNKGSVNLALSIPYVNSFRFDFDKYGVKSNTGFWGVSAGLEYFYKDNHYIGAKAIAATEFFLPIVVVYDPGDFVESLSTVSFELTNNFIKNRFSFGYGVNYSINHWNYYNATDTDNVISIQGNNRSIGLSTNIHFQLARATFVGIIYRPTFFTVSPQTDFKYEHFISLDFAFKIPLRRK